MMCSVRGQTGSLNLLHILLGAFLVHPEGGAGLELLPSASEVVLASHSNYTVVCSGWSQVTWRFPQEDPENGVIVSQAHGSSSVLLFLNATWRNSGRYMCKEELSSQSRHVDVFIPGAGPDQWFVPPGPAVVMKDGDEVTVPCVVSDPGLRVLLVQRHGRTTVPGTFEPGRGFTARLNDSSYLCLAMRDDKERESQVYHIFSLVVPQVMELDLSVSSSVLKVGEVLTINCTVKNTEMVYFYWTFPHRQEVEPLTDFLPNQIRSFINISMATLEDSGVYVCEVQETTQEHRVKKNVTVTVLERGYVYLWPLGDTNVSSLLHHTVALTVDIDAHPAPTVEWTRNNQTVSMETALIITKHLSGSRYVTELKLSGIELDQEGSYTAKVSNSDSLEEVTFSLEVKVPPKITSLSEIGNKVMLCVGEGAPPPSVMWYICYNSNGCSNVTDAWTSMSVASGGVALQGVSLQENVTEGETGLTQVHSRLTLQAFMSLAAVRCEVKNSAGRRVRDLRVLSSSLLSHVSMFAVVLVLVVISVILLIILTMLWRKKPGYEVCWKLIESMSPDGRMITYRNPAHLPYNKAIWEIPREDVELGHVLGAGAFGRVVEGKISDFIQSESETKAAVKMLKYKGVRQPLMSELKLLLHVGPHLNIVNLLGACTRGGPVYLITELCCHGDLVNFLRRNKHNIQMCEPHNKSDGGYMDMNNDNLQCAAMNDIQPAPDDRSPDVYCDKPCPPQDQQGESSSSSSHLHLHHLLSFSYQICQAMDFLSSRNCVHRDLAARNVLVCEGKLVKVCDFGLARDLMKEQDYVAKGNNFLPLKWMSPESIFYNIYSSQSDVWSYGVLLWEIFSLGESPYPDLPMTKQFCSALKKGHRMGPPEHAPQRIFQLMTQCWEAMPQLRPSFSSLVVSLGNLLPEEHNKRYASLSENFLKGDNPAVVRWRQNQTQTHESRTPHHQILEAESGESVSTMAASAPANEWSEAAVLDTDESLLHISDPRPQLLTSSEAPCQPSSCSGAEEEEESCL